MITKSRAAILACATIAFGAAAYLGYSLTLGKPPKIDDAAARTIAEAFLADVRSGQADAAWKGTTAEFQSLQGRETFRSFVKTKPEFKTVPEFVDCSMKEVNGLNLADLRYRSPGTSKTIRLTLALERGQWKVERLAVE